MKRKKTMKGVLQLYIGTRSLIAVTVAIVVMTVVYQFEVQQYVNAFASTRTATFGEVMAHSQQTLKNYARLHGHWDELLERIERNDLEWVQESATGYMLEDQSFHVDFAYLYEETTEFEDCEGIRREAVYSLLENASYQMGSRDFQEGIYSIEGVLYLVNGVYLSDNSGRVNRGIYLLGRKLDEVFLSDIKMMMNTEMIRNIYLEEQWREHTYPKLFDTEFEFSVPITNERETTDWHLRFVYDVQLLKNFFYYGQVMLVGLTVYFAFLINYELIKKAEGVLDRCRVWERKIWQMTKGDYGNRFETVEIEEVDSFLGSLNLLTVSLKNYSSQVHQDKVEMVGLLVKAVDINDHYTKGHSERVAEMAKKLAEFVGYSEPNKIELAGLLHDVGKISVPTHILNKPGRLTDEEFMIIKGHTERGYELLVESEVFRDIREAVHFHHERIDGKGYPMGLKGNCIPIEAMFISICDVYDALVTDRPYRKALSHEEAMMIIRKESGKAFTEELVACFQILLEQEKLQLET